MQTFYCIGWDCNAKRLLTQGGRSKSSERGRSNLWKTDSIHHHHPEAISGTATVLELRQKASIHHPLWVVVVYKIGLPKNTLKFSTVLVGNTHNVILI